MKKEELLPIHGLLYETAEYLKEDDDIDLEEGLEEYNKLGMSPNYAHKSKSDHKKAVRTLSTAITEALEAEETLESAQDHEYKIMARDAP